MDPALVCRFATGCAQVPSHLVLDPYPGSHSACPWHLDGDLEPTILWGLSTEPGVGGKLAAFPPPRTRWVAGAYLCTRERRKRTRNRKLNRQSRPSPTPQDPETPGRERCGELTRAF